MKQLTIAVPSYNSAEFLHIGLESYTYEDWSMDPRLEVIIINDGSTDSTLEVANSWAEKYPDNIKVIDKENGGHGSGINAGMDNASGRYIKVIDSDDWIITENLRPVLDALEKTNADIVTTKFHTVNIASGVTLAYEMGDVSEPTEVSMADFVKHKEQYLCAQMFHGLMYNTQFLKDTGLRMSEKIFFEDQEYAILPFMYGKTVLLLPYFFYEYQIGSQNQSVTFENQGKRESHLRAVLEKMINCHKRAVLSAAQEEFVSWRISNVAVSYYATVLVKGKDKKGGREKAAAFRYYLQKNEPDIFGACEGKYKMMCRLNRVPGATALYGRLFNSKLYRSFKKRWVKN